jgi:predicted RNase H-like nuclease (RuvC/YqgF family)
MSDYGYSPSCSPTYRREQETLWMDDETYIPKILRPPTSPRLESSEGNKEEELEKTKRELEKTKEELMKLSQVILKKDIEIDSLKNDVKEISNAYSNDVKILTKLWHLVHDISFPEKRVEIREVIQRWYISYWETF